MESLLGFKLDFWDYATAVVLFVCVITGLTFVIWLAWLPGRIAIARKHPRCRGCDAHGLCRVPAAGAVDLWIQAFIWAFKPTNTVDI
jgi:hypothetical protein